MKLYLLGSIATIAIISNIAQAAPISGQGTWQTTLQGRDLDGDISTFEAYYDTSLNITWLTSPANTDMGWNDANAWATGLNINGLTGWRLPTNTPLNGSSYNLAFSNNGTTDNGTAITSIGGGWQDNLGMPASEMGYMFYVTLGNVGLCLPNGSGSATTCNRQTGFGLSYNTANFIDLIPFSYWSGSSVNSNDAWFFNFNNGLQDTFRQSGTRLNSWAVRSGDVSTVPVPAAIWLFGSGLLCITGLARYRKT